MKRACLALIFVLVIAAPDACLSWMGKAVGVVRPDEIKVMTEDGKVENVRLYGIDSPVEPQDFGKAAHHNIRAGLGEHGGGEAPFSAIISIES
jgi:endonuclease YncB( thermonuclease family)